MCLERGDGGGREKTDRVTRRTTDAHLDDLVPTGRDDDGVGRVGRESDARDPGCDRDRTSAWVELPLGLPLPLDTLDTPRHVDSPLRVTLLLDVKLALSQSVPELDGLVPRGRDDLPVVGRERDREDVVGVSDESTGGRSGVEVPESESVVPRRREGELACESSRVGSRSAMGCLSVDDDRRTHRRKR